MTRQLRGAKSFSCLICKTILQIPEICADAQCGIFQEFRDLAFIQYRAAFKSLSSSTGGTELEAKFLKCETGAELSEHIEWVLKTFVNIRNNWRARTGLEELAQQCNHFQVATEYASLDDARQALWSRLKLMPEIRHTTVLTRLREARQPDDLLIILQNIAHQLEKGPNGARAKILLMEAKRFAAAHDENSPPASSVAPSANLQKDTNRVA